MPLRHFGINNEKRQINLTPSLIVPKRKESHKGTYHKLPNPLVYHSLPGIHKHPTRPLSGDISFLYTNVMKTNPEICAIVAMVVCLLFMVADSAVPPLHRNVNTSVRKTIKLPPKTVISYPKYKPLTCDVAYQRCANWDPNADNETRKLYCLHCIRLCSWFSGAYYHCYATFDALNHNS